MTTLDPAGTGDPPVFRLPERAELDPVSAAALALMDVVPPMLEQGTDGGAVAIDLKAIATTVLDAVAGLPRVPRWVEARAMGGTKRGDALPDPSITVDLDHADPGVVRCGVEVTVQREPDYERGDVWFITQSVEVPVVEARQWFLAGLAACAAAEAMAGESTGDNSSP